MSIKALMTDASGFLRIDRLGSRGERVVPSQAPVLTPIDIVDVGIDSAKVGSRVIPTMSLVDGSSMRKGGQQEIVIIVSIVHRRSLLAQILDGGQPVFLFRGQEA